MQGNKGATDKNVTVGQDGYEQGAACELHRYLRGSDEELRAAIKSGEINRLILQLKTEHKSLWPEQKMNLRIKHGSDGALLRVRLCLR